MVILTTIAFLVVGVVLTIALAGKPGGLQTLAMVAYTFLISYIASNRFVNLVPRGSTDSWRCPAGALSCCGACLRYYDRSSCSQAPSPHLPYYVGLTNLTFHYLYWRHPLGLGSWVSFTGR
jgi:hypothetical protein